MKTLNNEEGFASLLVIFTVVALGSLIVIQMSSAFGSNQMQNRHNRLKANFHLHMINLAQRAKRGYDLAQLDNNCSSYGSDITRKTLPGHTAANPRVLCRRRGEVLCITNPSLIGDNTPLCAPLANDKIDWSQVSSTQPTTVIRRFQPTSTSPGEQQSGTMTSTGNSIPERRTSISVPNQTDPIWKDCNGNTCMRLALCPLGQTNCTETEVVGMQTIMFQ